MSWQWHEKAWNGFADRQLNTLCGCSNVSCNTRTVCWARRMARRFKPVSQTEGYAKVIRGKPVRGCQQCYNFIPHAHPERWAAFNPRKPQRVALNFMGDMFDPMRDSRDIQWCLNEAITVHGGDHTYLIQTRHVDRMAAEWRVNAADYADPRFEFGTSCCNPGNLENLWALAKLPAGVKRFCAFEPWDLGWLWHGYRDLASALRNARLDWCYIGFDSSVRNPPVEIVRERANAAMELAEIVRAANPTTKIIYKPTCGAVLYNRNEGVMLQ